MEEGTGYGAERRVPADRDLNVCKCRREESTRGRNQGYGQAGYWGKERVTGCLSRILTQDTPHAFNIELSACPWFPTAVPTAFPSLATIRKLF